MKQSKSKRAFAILLPLLALSLSSCDIFDLLGRGSVSASDTSSSQSVSSSSHSHSESPIVTSSQSSADTTTTDSSIIESYDEIEFHFLQVGNGYTGDCIYARAGDNDILIDAGSKKGSSKTIKAYLDQYVEDGKLEYVVATHAHEDHIAGFVGSSNSKYEGGRDGILYTYNVENIIDFSYAEDKNGKLAYSNSEPLPADAEMTTIYEDYREARDFAIGRGATWRTVGEIWGNGEEEWKSIDLGEGIKMDILYNYFYDHTSDDVKDLGSYSFSDQNDYSVCLLFSQGDRHFLFTGDAEEAAEHSLVAYNDIPECELFKAGHHGSYTASGDELLSRVKPKIVCVCCCAGNSQYTKDPAHTFPAQEAIDRIAKYTDEVYVTTLGSMDKVSYNEPMNGDIIVRSRKPDEEAEVSCSASPLPLKDQPWFKENRTCPSSWQTAS